MEKREVIMASVKAKKAKEYMAERKSNCAQSVARVFSEELGLDENLALSVSQGFGGGMGHTSGVCGAVTGAYITLGLANKSSKENPRQSIDKTYGLMAEFSRKFKALHGSVNCTELLNYDLSKPEDMTAAREKGLFITKCPVFVEDAVKIVESLLKPA
jgi:C_GCAxxG_C_C family probable redox protein